MVDACLLGGFYRADVLFEALAGTVHGIGADEKHPRGTGKGLHEARFIVEVGFANFDALGTEACELGGVAGGGDDLGGWHLVGGKQVVDDGLAQFAGSAGDEIHGVFPFLL